MEQCVGTCSICGGDVMKHAGPWHGTIPPRGRCTSCGAVEACGPVIPMRPSPQRIPRVVVEGLVAGPHWWESTGPHPNRQMPSAIGVLVT